MSPARSGSASSKGAGGKGPLARVFSHRGLIAIEAMLLMGVLKDWIFGELRTSSFPNYAKVLLVMGTTVGMFGGLFFLVQRLTARGVAHTHGLAKRMPVAVPVSAVHAVLLFVLFLLYARMLRLTVF
jgi:hypothetical protein